MVLLDERKRYIYVGERERDKKVALDDTNVDLVQRWETFADLGHRRE